MVSASTEVDLLHRAVYQRRVAEDHHLDELLQRQTAVAMCFEPIECGQQVEPCHVAAEHATSANAVAENTTAGAIR